MCSDHWSHCTVSSAQYPEFLLKTVTRLDWDVKPSPQPALKSVLLGEVDMTRNSLPSRKNVSHGFSRPHWHLLTNVGCWQRYNASFGDLQKSECFSPHVSPCGVCPAALLVSTTDFCEWQAKAFQIERRYLNSQEQQIKWPQTIPHKVLCYFQSAFPAWHLCFFISNIKFKMFYSNAIHEYKI